MFQRPSIIRTDATQSFIPSGMAHSCSFSLGGTFVSADAVLCDATGFTSEDLIGRSFLSFIHPDDVDEVAAATSTWKHGPCAQPISTRFARKGGGYCWLNWSPFASGSDDVLCATVSNVTEDRRLRTLAAELEVMSDVGTWEIDLDTQFLYWSQVTFRIHELDPGTHKPKVEDGLSFYPEEAQDEIRAAVSALMSEGKRFDLELPFVTAKGRRIWVRATASAEIIGGKIVRVFGTFRDITEARAQREHLLRLSNVIHQARTTLIMCGVDRRIEWVNPAFEQLSGYSLAEARGRTVGSLVQFEKTDRDTIRAISAALDAQREFNGEILNRSKSGREYWINLNIQPLLDANGILSGFMAMTVDITERKTAEAQRELAEQEARRAEETLRSAVEVLPDAFALYDKDDRLVVFNERYLNTYALSAKAIVPGARFEDILRYGLAQGQYPEALGQEEAWLAQRLKAHIDTGIIQEQKLDNDTWVRVVEQKTPSGGRVGLRIDISELKDRERRLSEIIRGTNVGTWEWNVQTGETLFNERWAEIVGYTLEELQPTTVETWRQFAHPDDVEVSNRKLEEHWRGESNFYDASVRMRHRDGHWIWVLDRGRVGSWTPDGKPLWMFGTHQDITSSKNAERRLRREAWHDPLTGLTNRARFVARVSEMFNDPEQAKRLIVLALDLDGFKAVNDTLGHPVGDQVLTTVAKTLNAKLKAETRLQDYVAARFGGDEFMICGYVPSGDLETFCAELGETLISEIELPMEVTLGGGRLERCHIGASIGYSLSESTEGNIDIFLSNADIALYESKRRGKGVATAFRRSMREAAESLHQMTTELKAGIRGMEFQVCFQPQVSLVDGKLVGVEALARWHHPDRGLIGPDKFMAMAEKCNLTDALDGQIILESLQAYRQSQREGVDLGKLSINASGPTLRDQNFCDLLFNVAAGNNIRPDQVTVEILEDIFIQEDTDPAIQTLQKLFRAGFGVAIDDFGVGYSSLSRISRGEISAIKIDRSLIHLSGTGNMDTILKATAAMAKGMNATLVAEGIETEPQRAAIKALGFDVGQGFLWSKPLPLSELKQWVLARGDTGRSRGLM